MNAFINAYLDHARAAGLSANTLADRLALLRRVDIAMQPYGLIRAATSELERWLAGPAGSAWSVQTKATYYGHIRAFFAWACDERRPLLDWDPSAALSRPRVPPRAPRPVTHEQLRTALTTLPQPWRTYVLLAAYAGLRACEVASIRREDITEETITVTGKGGRTAVVPTHPLIWAAVRDLPPGPIARTERGGRATANYLSVMTSRMLRRHGLGGVTLHRFRHWLGTHSLRATGNLRITQELMRHSSPATTAIYTQVSDEERKAGIHALPVVLAAAA